MNRSLELNVSMYADDAMIKTKIEGKEKFITKKEFREKSLEKKSSSLSFFCFYWHTRFGMRGRLGN